MLRSNHPMTPHIIHASVLIEWVKLRVQKMSVSPSAVRCELLGECVPLFDEMRELARAEFAESAAFILAATDEYEAAVRELAAASDGLITEDRRAEAGPCPVCGTAIIPYRYRRRRSKYRLVLCEDCVKPALQAHNKLDSTQGFCTWVI